MMLKKVLCIEDDPVTLMLTRHVLVKSGFAGDVLSANNGQEALRLLEDQTVGCPPEIDLILLDINMPVMDGWQFLEAFITGFGMRHPETKVVIVSSSVSEEDFERAKSYEAVLRFISKPLTKYHLEVIKELKELKSLFRHAG